MFWQLVLVAALVAPDTEKLTMKQAVEMALAGNPDIRIAQAQEERARQAANEVRSTFIPSVVAGSGLAYTHGFPLSIEGSAPSIVQVVGSSQVLNIPQRHAVREMQAMSRAGGSSTLARRDEIVWRTASTYLDLDKTSRSLDSARRETESLARLEALTGERVRAGVEIPTELTRARLALAKNRQHIVALEGQAATLESSLKALLWIADDRRIGTVPESWPSLKPSPEETETAAIARAIENSPDLKRLAQEVEAKEARVKAEQAQKYPQMDLIAQYAVLSKANNYEDFFRKFERNNVEIGVSIRIPLFNGPRISARVGQAEAELTQAKQSLESAKRNTSLEIRKLFQRSRQAEAAREVARLELDLARETVSVLLARFEEGRIGARELEQARIDESVRFNALLEAGFEQDRTRLEVLRTTGEIARVLQ